MSVQEELIINSNQKEVSRADNLGQLQNQGGQKDLAAQY